MIASMTDAESTAFAQQSSADTDWTASARPCVYGCITQVCQLAFNTAADYPRVQARLLGCILCRLRVTNYSSPLQVL